MPQGSLEKIQRHLLLANLALKLGDLTACLGQIARLGRRAACQRHRRFLHPVRPPRPVAKCLLPAIAKRIAPAIKDRTLDPELASKSRPALPRLHPLDNRKLERS